MKSQRTLPPGTVLAFMGVPVQLTKPAEFQTEAQNWVALDRLLAEDEIAALREENEALRKVMSRNPTIMPIPPHTAVEADEDNHTRIDLSSMRES